jgi:single-stranded DNA-binding protein
MFNNQTFGKGDLVYIQGRIRNHSYVKNGATVYRDVYIIDKVERLISMKNQANRNTSHPVSQIDESFYPDTYQPVQQPAQQMVNNNTVMIPTGSEVDSDVPF